MKHVYLGVTDRDTHKFDPNAWQKFGFDLDRRATTAADSKTSRNSCLRTAGSQTKVLQDGIDGIDNNFGQHVMAVAKSIKADVEDVANSEIVSGGYTLLLRIDGVAPNTASAPGALYAVGPHSATAPTFAADDTWPVWSSSLVDGADLEKPVRTFPLGYVTNGTWVSGEVGEPLAPIWIPIFGIVPFAASSLLTLELTSGRGVIAGALPKAELAKGATAWGVRAGLCPFDVTLDQVTQTITQSVDLVLGAIDLQDPSRECDAVSFGIGFDVVPASPPTVVVAPPAPAPMECPKDGGA